jgi:Cd2+/Zn2+-exporting ATPase
MSQNAVRFRISGMDCAEEIAVLRRAVGPVVGGESQLTFDVLAGIMIVTPSDAAVSTDAIVSAVASTGMQAQVVTVGEPALKLGMWNAGLTWTVLSGSFLLLGFLLGYWNDMDLSGRIAAKTIAQSCLGAAILCGLRLVAPKAMLSAKRLQPDMNLLMTVAVAGALVIGEYLEAASVAFLFALSNTLETWSVRRAHRAISSLLDLTPPTARLLNSNGTEESRPIAEIAVHSRIIVKPGERIPLDGLIVAGSSHVNQAPITGESVPVSKQQGDLVFAGTVNGSGALEIETTKAADDTTVAHITRMIEDAQSHRSPSEQWVERFARVYTPAVMIMALLVFLIPPLMLGQAWQLWFYRSLVLLVIACPCALVISTPVSVVAGLAAAASRGVLVKGGAYLELPSRLRAIAFDKTGTLTEGHPSVTTLVPLNGHDETELLERVAGIEARSEHPLAKSILEYARNQGINVRPADNVQEIPGKGVSGNWNAETLWLGSARLLQERKQETPDIHSRIAAFASQGQTVVIVGNDQHVCGLVALADTLRPTAKEALKGLKARGISHLAMLTGDTLATAQGIGNELRVDEVRAEMLPAEKVQAVQELVSRFGMVAMVGDGVNDAPALATASLGIAMGVAGSDAAIETADIALMSNDLTKLPWLIDLSRRTMRTIQQNIWFSLIVKAIFVALTFAGYSTLWGAIAADTGASLLVIFNGLRLLK